MTGAAAPAAFPAPDDAPVWAPFWEAARDGRLIFQRCAHCANAFLPAREACPVCLTPAPVWEQASGEARLITWVVYHRAPDPAFQDRTPYAVAIVVLDEGPRLVSNIVGVEDFETLRIEQRLRLRIDQEAGLAIPRFIPA